MEDYSEKFMRLALEQANIGKSVGGGEVGCVITKNNKVIAMGYNSVNILCDPTAHAEMVTIRKAAESLQSFHLTDCTLYCTLQPCGMCTLACVWARVKKIVYGAGRSDVNSMYFDEIHLNTIDYIKDAYHAAIEITPRVLETDCSQLYKK